MAADSPEIERLAAAYSRRTGEGRYSAFEVSHLQMLQEVERTVLGLLRRHGWVSLEGRQVLDVGCGRGYWLRRMLDWGVSPDCLYGIDALPERVSAATSVLPSTVMLNHGDASALPWPDEAFDMVSQFVVFSSILDPDLRSKIASEMLRVLKNDGCLVWYDFHRDNPRNSDVVGIDRAEILRLFPECHIEFRNVTLAPPIARWVGGHAPWAIGFFSLFSLLRTHYVVVVRKTA